MADMKKQPMLDRRHFVGGALATSALAALAGCGQKGGGTTGGSGNAAAGGTTGGTLRYYINNPTSIDPYNLMEDQGTQVGFQLFDSLTQFDFEKEESSPSPAIAGTSTTTPPSSPSTSRRARPSTTATPSSPPTGSAAGSASSTPTRTPSRPPALVTTWPWSTATMPSLLARPMSSPA